ncbi:hypothetical protein T069G_08632 [Trichoderma breve]|uniref:Uncharacterized protein n=1 Tax=Trichoderma breve TaxID=2034170 RepID=A0A9W9E556_9HYPO|nr:hypothetical protein T069G_08632 [Trichoderma breve]KAJ4857735.1 hypothetical protein T069G_08632 [Trichoderma breve]
MPTSSTGAIYSSDSPGNKLQAASDGSTRPASLAGISDCPTESIDRFLDNRSSSNPGIVAEYQRPPIELREAQEEAEAETQARVRMLAQLQVFDKLFALSGDRKS